MSDSSDSEYGSSDEDLREAFAEGLLKPGLNVVEEKKQAPKNNVAQINKKLRQFQENYTWIEKLVLNSAPAPLAPELAAQMQDQENRRERQLRGNKKLPQFDPSDDPVLNDFRRETMFHRQAQSAAIEGIARLKSLNIPTKRPNDYYAEMAKTDEHMQKVKDNLVKKQTQAQLSEKIRQKRTQRKISKQMQVEATLKKHAEKKKLIEEVKKYRKGIRHDLDFLEGKNKLVPQNRRDISKKALEKKKMKDSKFGFGGKKRGLKKNTRASSADVSDYRMPGKPNKVGKFTNKSGKFGKSNVKRNSRPGKSRRVQMKAKRK